ncbi:protein of unknown function [Methylorubrum extorquens DM4]|uniref:Uncharacterized protein n=1 Tax=Methylorubrum extorquens (strain DSM 6343 / CIP 106787 / DM4) TaxID=661410 RepID=C7CEG4_METED|nr:protein of unknown function [Methylorubrum extorquens DM4]
MRPGIHARLRSDGERHKRRLVPWAGKPGGSMTARRHLATETTERVFDAPRAAVLCPDDVWQSPPSIWSM